MQLKIYSFLICLVGFVVNIQAQPSNPSSFYAKKIGELLEIESKPNHSPDAVIIRELPDQSTRIILIYKSKNPILRWCLLKQEERLIKSVKNLPWKNIAVKSGLVFFDFSIGDFEENLKKNLLDGDFCVVYSKVGLNDFYITFSSIDLSTDASSGAKKIQKIEDLLSQ